MFFIDGSGAGEGNMRWMSARGVCVYGAVVFGGVGDLRETRAEGGETPGTARCARIRKRQGDERGGIWVRKEWESGTAGRGGTTGKSGLGGG